MNRITYSNNRVTKNKSRMPLDLYIKLGPCKNFPYKLLWTIMDTLWTAVITQPQSIVVGKHFTVTIIKLLNVISQIPISHLLPIYLCTNSWNVRVAICLEGRLSLLALSSVYSLWRPALPGHWLSYTGCWKSLLVMYWLLCLGCCFYS